MARLESLIETLDRSKKRIVIAFGLAVLLHMPATPVLPMLRLMRRFQTPTPPASTQEAPPREVEVELREALRQEEQRKIEPVKPEPPTKSPSLAMAPPTPPPPAPPIKFAGAAQQPKPDPANPEKPVEPKKVKDVGLEGLDSKSPIKPGVTLGLWLSSLRDNPLGPRVAEVAACDREWKFFVDQGVDLLKDFDGALVVGPGLFEPRQMTVAVRHALPSERVHEVIDGLVRQSGANGRWVDEGVATARLGKVQRMLLPQQKDLFFVAPSKGWEALHKTKQPLSVPTAEGRVLSLVLAPPQKAMERAGLTLPKRIGELRLEVYANPDQSIDIRVELEDSSPEAAARDVKTISKQLHEFFADVWATASTLSTLSGNADDDAKAELAPRLDLSADEKTLSGMIHLSPSQTRTTLNLAASLMCRKKKPAKPNP
jgi:hypothetical protein